MRHIVACPSVPRSSLHRAIVLSDGKSLHLEAEPFVAFQGIYLVPKDRLTGYYLGYAELRPPSCLTRAQMSVMCAARCVWDVVRADGAALLIRLLRPTHHFHVGYFQLGACVVRVSVRLHLQADRSELAS